MRNSIKILSAFLVLVFLIGCNANEKPAARVDIWNSIQYEIISDLNTMKTIEPEAKANTYMLHFQLRLENKGAKTAEKFQAVLQEAYPTMYTNGSINQGIDTGELTRNGNYEIMGYYIFDSMENLEEFLDQSSFTIEWTENNEKKRLDLSFPIEPTQ